MKIVHHIACTEPHADGLLLTLPTKWIHARVNSEEQMETSIDYPSLAFLHCRGDTSYHLPGEVSNEGLSAHPVYSSRTDDSHFT